MTEESIPRRSLLLKGAALAAAGTAASASKRFTSSADAALPAPQQSQVVVGQTRGACDFCTLDYSSADQAVQAACNSLPALVGGHVVIAPGTYDFVKGVTVPDHTLLTGAGVGATIVRWKNGLAFPSAVDGSNWLLTLGFACTISDIQLTGNSTFACLIAGIPTYRCGTGRNARGSGILVTRGRTFLDRVYVNGMAEDGITNHAGIGTKYGELEIIGCGGVGLNITSFRGANGGYASDGDLVSVWVGSCGTGINVGVGGTLVTGSHIWGCLGDGLVMSESVRAIGCYLESNLGYGARISGDANVITGSDFWKNGKGGVLVSGNHNIIGNTAFRNNLSNAVYLAGRSTLNLIQGNALVGGNRVSIAPTALNNVLNYNV